MPLKTPIAANDCRARLSFLVRKNALDLSFTHAIEVVRYTDLPRHKTEPLDVFFHWRGKGSDLDDRFACLRNYERFAPDGFLQQARESRLGFVDAYSLHLG